MADLPITEFNLKLMEVILHRLQLLQAGTEPVSVGEAFVELSDVLAQHPDFLLHDLTRVVGRTTGLLRHSEFFSLGGRARIELADTSVPLSERSFKLLDRAPMAGFTIT